ncbi:MAG: hypothetical protein VYC67_00960 [Pseudomonadota bacterium]|nr:hypothetical protein [Pseudomonadota bacterium]
MDLHSIQAGRTLHYEQSVLRGVLGAFVALIIVNVFWVSISMFFDRFFPWISILQGILIGQAFRKYGLGLDWYVPLLAALVAILASITGSFLSALNLTGREFNTGAIALIDEISWHTIKTFLINEFGVVGIIYGIFAGILAAYYAKRRLTRDQSIVFRKYKESKQS